MYLNTTHADYDLAMELVCLLPCMPTYARMADVTHDLNISMKKVYDLIETLRERGIAIDTTNGGGRLGRIVGVLPQSWNRAMQEGNDYYNTVYGIATPQAI